mmetsp:Transcript_2307/g.6910  ORF Transcript_2307/g.6910 Transcript_2307/m.6910 type:complete len:244 (-) Transcript_2307:669-1400(-)
MSVMDPSVPPSAAVLLLFACCFMCCLRLDFSPNFLGQIEHENCFTFICTVVLCRSSFDFEPKIFKQVSQEYERSVVCTTLMCSFRLPLCEKDRPHLIQACFWFSCTPFTCLCKLDSRVKASPHAVQLIFDDSDSVLFEVCMLSVGSSARVDISFLLMAVHSSISWALTGAYRGCDLGANIAMSSVWTTLVTASSNSSPPFLHVVFVHSSCRLSMLSTQPPCSHDCRYSNVYCAPVLAPYSIMV